MTDSEPVLLIKKKLRHLNDIKAADIGCGTGRYDVELFRRYGKKLHLACVDDNQNMLKELLKNLKAHKIKNYKTIRAPATTLPLPAGSLDVITTFNAVHHFRLLDFLNEAHRVLKDDGILFIYTRLRCQNRRNIWGRYFPRFHEKEKRLYEIRELRRMLKEVPVLKLESIDYFKYKRAAKLERLMVQATLRHYSTFNLYTKKEFDHSLRKFRDNIVSHFENPNRVIWHDENILLSIRKTKPTKGVGSSLAIS